MGDEPRTPYAVREQDALEMVVPYARAGGSGVRAAGSWEQRTEATVAVGIGLRRQEAGEQGTGDATATGCGPRESSGACARPLLETTESGAARPPLNQQELDAPEVA